MDVCGYSTPKSTTEFWSLISVFFAQLCPLWRTGLLLCSLHLCACLEEEHCVLGIVGHPVSLPCFYSHIPKFENLSIEWRTTDGDLVLRSTWTGEDHDQMWGFALATLSDDDDAAQTGNFSLKLLEVEPHHDNTKYSLFITSEEDKHAPLCTVCLRVTARFSSPHLQREDSEEGGETTFLCQSSGGYPQPTVYWLINNTEEPPEGSVRTLAEPLHDSFLYNVTSHLKVNISKDSSVSCIIDNLSANETLRSTSYGVNRGPTVSRASDAMWMFSTGLCVVVGAMVIAGVAYQIHLDRISKRKKKEYQESQRGNKRRRPNKEETEVMRPVSKETDV